MKRGVASTAWLLLVTQLLSACSAYSYRPGSPAEVLVPGQECCARVTLDNGTRIELHDPAFRDDSLVGFDAKFITRLAVPAARVRSIETMQLSAGRTSLLIGGILFAAAAVMYANFAVAMSHMQ
jgi:hypothetical protein